MQLQKNLKSTQKSIDKFHILIDNIKRKIRTRPDIAIKDCSRVPQNLVAFGKKRQNYKRIIKKY